MTDNLQEMCSYYLDRFRDGNRDGAFFGLIEAPGNVIPFLVEAFRAESDSEVRDFLVKVISEHRDTSTIPFLAGALSDPSPAVWKQSLDGLVTFGTPEASEAIAAARSRKFSSKDEQREFQEWIEEALKQVSHKL